MTLAWLSCKYNNIVVNYNLICNILIITYLVIFENKYDLQALINNVFISLLIYALNYLHDSNKTFINFIK